MINRHILIIFTAICAILPATAQKGLNINELFDGQFREDKNAVETLISGDALADYDLNYYHSLSLSENPALADRLESLVLKDGATAVDKEVSYRGGKLYYAFYTLPPVKNKVGIAMNRYIFYINQYAVGRDGIILIYLSGIASRDQVKKLLKK